MLIDSHAHIYDEKYGERGAEKIISDMSGDGLEYIVCVGCDIATSRQCVVLAESDPRVYATVGVHPYDADTVTDENIAVLAELASSERVCAIGEFGLDFHCGGEDRQLQLRAMEKQYALSIELGLPTVYHIRDGMGEFIEFAKDRKFDAGAIMHCFSGSPETAEYFVKKGFYISFSGTLTYRNAVKLARAAAVVPTDRLLIETDSPYLTPSARAGELNYPKNVRLVAQKLAEIRGVTYAEIERATAENAKRVFGIS